MPLRTLRGAMILTGVAAYTLPLMPLQALLRRFWRPGAVRLPHHFHRGLCRLLGVRVIVEGEPIRDMPCLIAANHASWLDIPVLSACAPVSFVSKQEVGTWPFFGTLARLQRTLFVDRDRRSGTGAFRDAMQARLAQGDRLVLFPEGTSGTGNVVLPFKSALMGAADCKVPGRKGQDPTHVLVQPVSVAYTHLHGVPMGRQFRPHYAWYGDMDLPPHLWGVLRNGPVDVIVRFHEPVTIDDFGNRKALTRHCEETVSTGVVNALSGREQD